MEENKKHVKKSYAERAINIFKCHAEGGEIMEPMSQAAIEARRQYKRRWNRANREKVRAAQARYWERRAAQEEKNDDDERAD